MGEIGVRLAQRAAETVKNKVPDGGWYTIYKLAISYFEDPVNAEWRVAGKWPVPLSSLPADSTQVEIQGDTEIAGIMRAHNMWTIDMIPSIVGGYRATAVARQASSSEVSHHRARLEKVIDDVKKELSAAGAVVEARGLPTIAGKVYADIAWMGTRLEHGLGGLPRKPHWLPAFRELINKSPEWTSEISSHVDQIMLGRADRGPKPSPPPKR